MSLPDVSVLLCTVREYGFAEHPDLDVVAAHVADLSAQTHASFELVVVDGLFDVRKARVEQLASSAPFRVKHVPPRQGSPWVRMRKVAISAYRNTGIAAAEGELIINVDDTSVLPREFVETFWCAWQKYEVALAMTWPGRNDWRKMGFVDRPGMVFGYGSYPRELALDLNGYDEAYDGAQALEDGDWSTRLFNAGLKSGLITLPGFDILAQTGHDPRAVDIDRPIVKCCNAAWQTQRVWRQTHVANRIGLWSAEALRRLVGPCLYLRDGMCGHHNFLNPCPYLNRGFPLELDAQAAIVFDDPPVLDLRALANEVLL